MLEYITIDSSRNFSSPRLFDTYYNKSHPVSFGDGGARSYLRNYINNNNIKPISIHETQLPDRTQLVCWYER